MNVDNGRADVTIQRFYSGIRIYGTYTPTNLAANCIKFRSSKYYINGVTSIPGYRNNQIYTGSFMIKDNTGTVSGQNFTNSYFGIIDEPSSSANVYYRNYVSLSKTWKKTTSIFVAQARFKPCIRVYFNVKKREPVPFDISIKNICLYEGAFVNPPYVQDYLSRIGIELTYSQDEAVERDDGYLLSNTLPPHAREFIINNGEPYFDYNKDKNIVLFSYLYNTSNLHHIVKGSLYLVPSTQYTTALRKWDILVWDRHSGSSWTNIYNTCVEDTSYRKQTSAYDYNNDLYKCVIKSGYIHNGNNSYIGLCFHGGRVGTEAIWVNSRYRIIFVPEIMNSTYSSSMEWIHIDKTYYNSGIGTFVESA